MNESKNKKRQPMKKDKVTKIDYTLEQFLEEQKRANKIIETLEKMASTMEKFEDFSVLINHRVTQMEKKIGKK